MTFNEKTGEVIEYERVPYKRSGEYPKTLFLSEVKSVDDMSSFMKTMVDKRKIRSSNHNDLLRYFEGCLGYKALDHDLFGKMEHMTVPQYRLLNSIGELVEYKNVIMTHRKTLTEHLGCKDNNLVKKLNTVRGYIEVYTQNDGIRKGEIKILVNPRFFYIYDYGLYDLSRDESIRAWYSHKLEEQGMGSDSYILF